MVNSPAMDASQIIDKLGGTNKLAAALGLTPPAVSMWRSFGIPPGRWPAIVALPEAKAARIGFEVLAAVGK